MPPARRGRRATVSPWVIATRLGLYLILTWGTLIVLSRGLFTGSETLALAFAIYSMVPVITFALFRGWPFYPGAVFRLLVVRPFWYTQLLLPLVSGAGLLGIILGAPFGHALEIGRVLAGTMLAITAVLIVLGYLGTRRLVVRSVDADVPGLPAEFEGLRIVQLSDTHIGPHTNRRFLRRVVDTARSLQPDIIAVTGDLIDDRAEDVAAYARALGSLEAPLGVYMIAGNHDVYAGWDEVEKSLRSLQLGTVLVNEVKLLRRGDATLAIVGTALYLTLSIKAINLTRRQSNFIDSVTHELKSPIASLKLYLQTLNRRSVSPAEQEVFFKDMLQDVERLDQLINHLLDVARIEKDRTVPQPEELRVDEVIQRCAAMVSHRYQRPLETIELETLPAIVNASRVDLELIFRNLIDNGMKYANEEDPRVNVAIQPDGENQILVRVTDNGRGIPHSLRHLIFGRFVRLGSELEREKPGTGLGLYIVRTMITRLGGKIRIRDREPGPGTIFEVQLPGKVVA